MPGERDGASRFQGRVVGIAAARREYPVERFSLHVGEENRPIRRVPQVKAPPTDRLLGSGGDLADFGKAVAFLCSEPARFITGTSLLVDGGACPGLP